MNFRCGLIVAAMGILSSPAHADFDFQNLSMGFGLAKTSYSENSTSLVPTSALQTVTPPASGSVSSVVLDVAYEFYTSSSFSYSVVGFVPVVGSGSQRILQGGLSANWYFQSLSSKGVFIDDSSTMQFKPTWSYYVGLTTAADYLVYSTTTAQKNDVFFNLAAQVGVRHAFTEDWGGKVEASIGRGIGIETSSINMRFVLAATYYFDH